MIGTTVRQPLHRELGALPGIQWPVTVVNYIYTFNLYIPDNECSLWS